MSTDGLLNCWQSKKCGREPRGKNIFKFGVCPVAIEAEADGLHHGENGGRCCWVLTDSVCQKNTKCSECDFYLSVEKSEKLLFSA